MMLDNKHRAIEEVLNFWFADPDRAWRKDAAFDAEIRRRFASLHAAIERREHEDWCTFARGTLAYVIVLDQFSRNIYRGTSRMFSSDAQALAASKMAITRGDDQALSIRERHLLYMPLMHSESMVDQDRSVELFTAVSGEAVKYAERHRDTIRKFGRFPHRNALLDRPSTTEECAFPAHTESSL